MNPRTPKYKIYLEQVKSEEDFKDEIYLEERKSLVDAKIKTSSLLDKSILTLSAGTFGLSLTFIKQIAAEIRPETVFMIKWAWGSFCVSMLLILLSFFASQKACDKAIINLAKEQEETNIPGIITDYLNIISIICFIIGSIFLVLFSLNNLPIKEG